MTSDTRSGQGGHLGERPDYEQWVAAVVEAVDARPSAVEGHRPLRPARHRSRKMSGLFVRVRRA